MVPEGDSTKGCAVSAARFDVAVIGGGLVGAALAFGMRSLGARLALFDEGDLALRASRGNFGLIWVQGKGLGMPAYGAWTQASARLWPEFAALLRQIAGVDVALRQPGGLHVCLSENELAARAVHVARLLAQPGFPACPVEMLDGKAARARVPGLGPQVAGGSWCGLDGECNPLRLLQGLHAALARAEVGCLAGAGVTAIESRAHGFVLRTATGTFECERVVLAAGLGNARLAPMVGLVAPVTPNQGQVVVLERVQRFLDVPLETIRQTDDGTVLLGDSQQARGVDDAVDPAVLAAIAARAAAVFPQLRDVRVNRAWAALRVMSPDGFPIYAQSSAHPGASIVTCHSGVTLAAVHALVLGPALLHGAWPATVAPFTPARFDVRAAA
jgi:glycine/D-amino acid oxidase-like deaminating enzyme